VFAGVCAIVFAVAVAWGWLAWAGGELPPDHGRQIAATMIRAAADTKITSSKIDEIVIRGSRCDCPYCTVPPPFAESSGVA
jgi:hypothetical protein